MPGWRSRKRGRLQECGVAGSPRVHFRHTPGARARSRECERAAARAEWPIMASPMDIADLRREYQHATLSETEVHRDPLRQFERWLEDAVKAELPEPTAMA